MHKTKLKAAVDRYADQDLKATALLAALQTDDKGYTEEEVDEIFAAIMESKKPVHSPTHGQVAAAVEGIKAQTIAGYTICDIWNGSWQITKTMLNPLTGRRVGIVFEFLKAGKVKREKVKVEQRRMEALNHGAHINVEGIVVEQIIPVDHEGPWTYEREVIDGIPQ